ncbi:MAG: CopG family transcriptional regulator [Actinomycetes bacterium]
MRTTINISEQLYRAAKARAAESSQTVSEVIEDAVREALRPKPQAAAATAPLPVFGGSGVLPGVDLSDGGALRDLMDAGGGADALR